MADSDERTLPRLVDVVREPGYANVSFEAGITYTDGYRVTVGWVEADDCWYARCSGISTGDVLGHGSTKQQALLCLVCALACTIDAVNAK